MLVTKSLKLGSITLLSYLFRLQKSFKLFKITMHLRNMTFEKGLNEFFISLKSKSDAIEEMENQRGH